MRKTLRISLAAALLVPITLLGGCASTKVTSTWEAPSAQQVQFNKVLVVAVVASEPVRRQMEDRLADELRAKGMNATQSYRFVQEGAQMNRDMLKQIATTNDFDGVLVTRYLGRSTKVTYVPGTTYYDYYGTMWPDVYGAGYYESYESLKAEANLFSVKDGGTLIWSAQAETYDPGSAAAATSKLASRFVKKMDEDIGI